MEPFDYMKALVLNFRLYNCCWCVPVRIGLIATGYLNGIVATFCVIGTANDSISPTLMQVQMKIMPDYITKSVVMLAYITEVCFSMLCLCGIYRKDLVLLRVYMYYCASALMFSIMVYSIVILAIDLIIQINMICGILFQVYVLLLVRSAIVEIKWENKQYDLPTLVLSSLINDKEPMKDQISIKSQKDDQEKQEIEVKIETAVVKSETEKASESSSETEKKNEPKKDAQEKKNGPQKSETEKKNGSKKDETEKKNVSKKDETEKKNVSKKDETEKKNGSKKEEIEKNIEPKKDGDGKLETVKEEVSTSAENKSSSARRIFLRY